MTETLITTGLVTGAVNQELAPTQNTVPAQITMPDGWTIHKIAAFVRDIAMNMYDLPVILQKHELSTAQYNLLKENEFFKKAIEAATIEWNSPQSTQKRLAMEAAIALEDAMPTLAARMSKENEPLPGLVQLATLFAKIAGVGEHSAQGQAVEKVKITINLGADILKVEKNSAPNRLVEVQPLPERESQDNPLQQFLDGTRSPS